MKHTYNYLLILFTVLGMLGVNSVVQAKGSESQSILLLGIDTGDLGRIEQGRSDTIMVMNINNDNGDATIASIPRDAYVNIPGYGMDKINHAYAFGGVDLSMATVNDFLGTNIQSYVVVNMAGLKEIIDVVGTVTVTPPTSFTIGGYDFIEGVSVDLDSDMALAYARERYTSGGDYARQERQRQIVEAIILKTLSVESITNYIPLFSALSDNIVTNLSLPDLLKLYSTYNGASTFDTYQLVGYGEMIDGIYYDQIDSDSLITLQGILGVQ